MLYEDGILRFFSEFSNVAFGSFAAAFVLFGLPMLVLAAGYPCFIKMASRDEEVGVSSGKISAISTMGSLIGTFLTSFYLVPTIGAVATVNLYAVLLLISAAAGAAVYFKNKKYFFAISAVSILGGGSSVLPPGVIYKTESFYSNLEVLRYDDSLVLRADKKSGTAYSYIPGKDFGGGNKITLYNLFAAMPAINGAKNMAILGLGAGTISSAHRRYGQDMPIDGVEIDQKVIDIGKQFFHLDGISNLNIIREDGRRFLAKTDKKYDLIEEDVFWGGPNMPFYMATREFFNLVAEHLSPSGILAMNVYDPSRGIIINPIANTMASVFGSVYSVNINRGSYLVFASNNGGQLTAPWSSDAVELGEIIDYVKKNMRQIAFNPKAHILTDDKSDIEALIRLALNY